MKYYRYLFQHMKEFSPNEGIVYSELLFHSLMESDSFMADGNFSTMLAKDKVQENKEGNRGEVADYYPVREARLMKLTGMTYPTVKKALTSIKKSGLIQGDYIKCPLKLLDKGYIEIPLNTRLTGRQLVFYGLLLDRSAPFGGVTDTHAYRYKDICHLSEDNVYWLISQLHKKGFVERTKNGMLKVVKKE